MSQNTETGTGLLDKKCSDLAGIELRG